MFLRILNEINLPFVGNPMITRKQMRVFTRFMTNKNYKLIPVSKINIVNINLDQKLPALYDISMHRPYYSKEEYQTLLNKIANTSKSKHNALLIRQDLERSAETHMGPIFFSIYNFAKLNQITIKDAAFVFGINTSYIGDGKEYKQILRYLNNYVNTKYGYTLTDIPGKKVSALIKINRNRFKDQKSYLIYFDKDGFRQKNMIVDQIRQTFTMEDQNVEEEDIVEDSE